MNYPKPLHHRIITLITGIGDFYVNLPELLWLDNN